MKDFFARTYDDLNPFWTIEIDTPGWQASTYVQRTSVRNDKAKLVADHEWTRITVFETVISSVAEHISDLDIATNVMHEAKIIAP